VTQYLWIALGSAVGGALRYWSYGIALRVLGQTFPWGTLVVNVIGSAIIGFFVTFSGPDSARLVPLNARLFVTVGFCGGYTTFSTFSLETLNLLRGGEWGRATLNIFASVLLCIAGAWVGHVMAAALNRR
jgi:fluoride exporter